MRRVDSGQCGALAGQRLEVLLIGEARDGGVGIFAELGADEAALGKRREAGQAAAGQADYGPAR